MTGILRKNLARDYALTLSWRYAEVEFLGLPKLKDSGVYRLEHIYVPLRLCRDWKQRFDPAATVHVPQALQEHKRLIVLGDPGSGKSTLVKVLTYAFGEAKDNPYKRACGELIPIPIILRSYNTRRWETHLDMLRDFVATLDPDIRNEITPEWLLAHLSSGQAILLIDGVDEVGSRAEREHLRDNIVVPLLQNAPASWVVITSRVVGYDEVPFEFIVSSDEKRAVIGVNPECWYVTPFNDDEIKQFVTRWYALREPLPEKQQEGIDSLMRALNQNDRVKRLVHNPQLLTLVALIHRVTANLPSGRVELYDKIVEAYLETIQVYRKLGTPARLDEMKRWLANVGWQMQTRRDEMQKSSADASIQGEELLVTRAEIKTWLMEAIEKERGAEEAPDTADRFLDYVARRSGLLVPRGPNEFSFAHLTFQEYFAAFELRSRVRRFEQLAQLCVTLVERRHWHETLNLLFEMLTEFPGACDDLFDVLIAQTGVTNSAAEFLSLLLPDEQSGLSPVNQTRAAQFVLDRVCEERNEVIIKNLRQLNATSFKRWVRDPLTERLNKHRPDTLPRSFLSIGNALLEDWQALICKAIETRGTDEWTVPQVAEMTVRCKSPIALVWASNHLTLPHWFSPLNLAQQTLAGELSPILVSYGSTFSAGLFLAQTSLVSSLFHIQLLRINLHDLSFGGSAIPPSLKRHLEISLFFKGDESTTINGLDISDSKWILMRFMLMSLLDLKVEHRVLIWGTLLNAVISASEKTFQHEQMAIYKDELVLLGTNVKHLASGNFEPLLLKSTVALINKTVKSPNHWTRLISLYYLLVLGKGSPERCAEFNSLLDHVVTEPRDFIFPQQLEQLMKSSEFFESELSVAMRLLFWHEPGDALFKPEWFDPARPESRFFLRDPQSLIALAQRSFVGDQNEGTDK